MGDKARLSDFSAALAEAGYEQGHFEDAERWTGISASAAATYALDGLTGWRVIQAKLLARRGEFDGAERLAREAVGLAEGGDGIVNHADVLIGLAHVLRLAGRSGEALAVAREALQLYEQKGNIASAGKTQALLEELRQLSPSSPI